MLSWICGQQLSAVCGHDYGVGGANWTPWHRKDAHNIYVRREILCEQDTRPSASNSAGDWGSSSWGDAVQNLHSSIWHKAPSLRRTREIPHICIWLFADSLSRHRCGAQGFICLSVEFPRLSWGASTRRCTVTCSRAEDETILDWGWWLLSLGSAWRCAPWVSYIPEGKY